MKCLVGNTNGESRLNKVVHIPHCKTSSKVRSDEYGNIDWNKNTQTIGPLFCSPTAYADIKPQQVKKTLP